MPNLPHTFPTLRAEPNGSGATRQCVIVVGAGFSYGLVPMAERLFSERHQSVQERLGCATSAGAADLYCWADEILQQLRQRNGAVPPKLELAEALGIVSDLRWRGANRDGPVEPRHRVIARFARENRLNSIWSLNWDCLLENALERVGLSRSVPRANLPWKTQFTTFLTLADYALLGSEQLVPVFKPHGCVLQLLQAKAALDANNLPAARRLADRFRVAKAELDAPALDPNETHLHANLGTRLAHLPLIVMGWSISESYLRELIQRQVTPALEARVLAVDELSVVDPVFSDGHRQIATSYNLTQTQAHVAVEKATGFTTDALCLWLQAYYAVQHLRDFNPNEAILRTAFAALESPCADHWLFWWADEWLPGWCRLCWRLGSVNCVHNNICVPPEHLDLESPDAHIPLNLQIPRPDLVAAAQLLARIWPGPPRWDFRKFPAALFYPSKGQLVLPVPTWTVQFGHIERALKPLMNLWKPHFGIVRSVALLGLDAGLQTANGAIEHWRQAVARAFPASRVADPQNVATMNMNQL